MSKKEVSYSQYTTYLNCPLQWKLKYIDGLEGPSGIEAVFGTSMHETIQAWLKLWYDGTKIQHKTFDMHELLKERLFANAKEELLKGDVWLTNKEELLEYYKEGCNILDDVRKHAKDWFPQAGHKLIGVEVKLSHPINDHVNFIGYIDIVIEDIHGKIIKIYDLKTSKRGWSWQKKDEKKIDQLLLYKRYYAQQFGVPFDNIQVEFIILKRQLPTNTEYSQKHLVGFAPSHGKPSMKRAGEKFDKWLAEAYINDVPNANVKATPSEQNCRYCPFNKDKSLCSESFYLKD